MVAKRAPGHDGLLTEFQLSEKTLGLHIFV